MTVAGALTQGVPPALFVWLAAALAGLLGRRTGTITGVCSLFAVAGWAALVPDGSGPTWNYLGFHVVPVAVDPAARVVGVAFAGFGAVAVGYLFATGADRAHVAVALAYAGGALWATFAGDWLGLLIGWELMAVASTLLVWLAGGDAVRAGYRYAIVHALGGALLAAGLALHVADGGAAALRYDGSGVAAGLPALVVGVGILVNAAAIGVHVWLPDTYARPHVGTSVVLSAYTTKLAAYAAHRAFPDGNIALAYLGGVMAVFGAAYAIAQKDARRLLAYHIQAQVGYVLAGIGVGSTLGVAGGFAHLFNNVLFKGLLFMVVGVVAIRTGTDRLDRFGALGTSAPVLLSSFLVAAAAITGVPGTNGFVSKGMVTDAAAAAGHAPLEWLLLVGAVGTFLSFLKLGHYAFRVGDPRPIPDVTRTQAATMVPVAVACVALGIAHSLLLAPLPGGDGISIDPYAPDKLLKTGGTLLVALAGFVLGKPHLERLNGGVDVDALRDPAVFYGIRSLVAAIAGLFGVVERATQAMTERIMALVRDPVGVAAQRAPEARLEALAARAPDAPGTLGIFPSVGLRLIALAASTALALTIGVAWR